MSQEDANIVRLKLLGYRQCHYCKGYFPKEDLIQGKEFRAFNEEDSGYFCRRPIQCDRRRNGLNFDS